MRQTEKGMYSDRLERAIQKAIQLHKNQLRRSPDELPYVSHLFSVYIILSSYTSDEDTLIAGLLHDAIEDTEYTLKELEADFGPRVSRFVRGVTEEKERDGKPLPWKERKRGYLENLKGDSEESMLICVADKIYNLQALKRDYEHYGESMWKFIQPNLKEKLWYHEEVLRILTPRIRNRRALYELAGTLSETRGYFNAQKYPEETKKWSYSGTLIAFPVFALSWYTRVGKRLNSLRSRALSAKIFGYGNRNTS